MVKCPFCGFSNEDGALFCEQCKSDLSAVPPAATESVPVAEVIEATPVTPGNLTPVATAEVMQATLPEGAIPAAEIVAAPPVPMELPEPVPAMAPPLEKEIMAAEAAHAAAAPADAAPPAAAGGKSSVPVGAKPKLVVKRGQKIGFEFPIYGGENYVGRADEKPVDIDLEDQEPPDRVWCSRQHALIHYDEDAGKITLEDLNSSNGTYVNRERVYPGQPRQLYVNDTVQIGTVHLTLKV